MCVAAFYFLVYPKIQPKNIALFNIFYIKYMYNYYTHLNIVYSHSATLGCARQVLDI